MEMRHLRQLCFALIILKADPPENINVAGVIFSRMISCLTVLFDISPSSA